MSSTTATGPTLGRPSRFARYNAKDIAAGVFLILLAAIGLWLNGDHNIGTARRMGPGYMPMLVFWLQLGLGCMVLAFAFFNGPDPLERWLPIDYQALVAALVAFAVVYFVLPLVFGGTAPTPNGTGTPAAGASQPGFLMSGYNHLGFALLVAFLVQSWSAGWRLMAYICAAMCVFGLVLEKGGLMLATAGTVGVAALAEPEHRKHPLGVLLMIIFLAALCWFVFINRLDIRVAVWPQF